MVFWMLLLLLVLVLVLAHGSRRQDDTEAPRMLRARRSLVLHPIHGSPEVVHIADGEYVGAELSAAGEVAGDSIGYGYTQAIYTDSQGHAWRFYQDTDGSLTFNEAYDL